MTVAPAAPVTLREIARTWWPLAASWTLMGLEIPTISAVVSRLDNPEIHLAAFGSLVFPLALLIEAPIIMMLAASTALSGDARGFHQLRKFMIAASVLLTALQVVIAFTPLFDWIALSVIDVPPEVVEPGRLGLQIMTFWTWAIADRRFHQGLLIRFGRQHLVGVGAAVRLVATGTPLVICWQLKAPGIVACTASLATGVLVEAVFARIVAAPIIRGPLAAAAPTRKPLSWLGLMNFYTPLMLTPVIMLAAQPIGSAGMSRMPLELLSLAAWPVVNGLSFFFRGSGMGFNEVAVRLGGQSINHAPLRRFAWGAGLAVSGLLLVLTATPAAHWLFGRGFGLEPNLAALASASLWWAVPMPLFTFLAGHHQGLLVAAHRTRPISEAVAWSLGVTTAVLAAGAWWDGAPGVHVAMAAFLIGAAAQVARLAWATHRMPDAISADDHHDEPGGVQPDQPYLTPGMAGAECVGMEATENDPADGAGRVG